MKKTVCKALAALTAAACLLCACGPEPGRQETGNTLFGEESGAVPAAVDAQEDSGAEKMDAEASGDAVSDTAGSSPVSAVSERTVKAFSSPVSESTAGTAGITGSAAVQSADEASGSPVSESTAGISGPAAAQSAAGTTGSPASESTGGISGSAAAQNAAGAAGSLSPESTAGTSGSAAVEGSAAAAGGGGKAPSQEAASSELVRIGSEELQALEDYLNEDSSYGFLLSVYEKPEDIDLHQVFYAGAGYPRKPLEEKEKELLLERTDGKIYIHSVTKVTEEQIAEVLSRKAGITYEQSNRPLDGWTRIRRYNAYYFGHGDTNQRLVRCTDGWKQGDTVFLHYQAVVDWKEGPEPSARYLPTYEVQLRRNGEDYQFCSNIFWIQKDLIEAQSYQAEMNPAGNVFFAPFYPDTEADPKADVSFGIVAGKELRQVLEDVEEDNIRDDRIFTGVDAVDFVDCNKDGYTDVLTVCSYQTVDSKGNRSGSVREARVYHGTGDGLLELDEEETEDVNDRVETLSITNITEYLTGKSDGRNKKFSSWKEAFADHLRGLETEEYKGYALIHLKEGRTPAFVQVGATKAKGATVVVYRNGILEETWLNRNTFQYLEYENLLYSASGIENLHYDTIYSIVGGRLQVSVQGYYGNRNFASVLNDAKGKPVYQYFWDGGEVSQNGYLDGMAFVFDASRAKTCGEEGLLTEEEMMEKLEK